MNQFDENFATIDSFPRRAGGENAVCEKSGIAETAPGRTEKFFAAIDLGTNKCRLLIAQPGGSYGFQVIETFSSMVWLGDGLSADNLLHPSAIERAVTALRICAAKLSLYQPVALRVVGTAACRRAANAEDFLERVVRETGFAIEIISAEQEAMLALQGCAALIDQAEPYGLMFDIGGGSTEILWLEREMDAADQPPGLRRRGFVSLPFGVANLLNACQENGASLAPAQIMSSFAMMRDLIIAALKNFEYSQTIKDEIAENAVQMLGCSSTITTITAKHLDLKRYDRARVDGQFISRINIEREIAHILDELSQDHIAIPPIMSRRRHDFVLAGCAIIAAILSMWPVERLRVADRGVREGILLGLMEQSL
ncbi:MAG: hypothetical protein QM537_06900 [Candidatus Symbiobacter sp.]|nr:hypothetical protein [Candidatus Symbiobacter sp.]